MTASYDSDYVLAVDRARAIAAEIDRLLGKLTSELRLLSEDDTPLDDLASLMDAIDELKTNTSSVRDMMEERMIAEMGDLPEIGPVEKKTGSDRKSWDHAGLGEIVSKRIVDLAIDFETGEILKSHQEIAQEMLKFAAPSYWRIKSLKEIGVDADQFCEVKDPITRIQVRRTS